MGRGRTRAADIRRRLTEDEKEESPFASIKLVEKKEEPKKLKKKQVPPVPPKKPSEIVQGYDPSSSFADILYSYEHTGNPYSMPSASKKRQIAEKKTDFGAILDAWEGRGSAKQQKPKAEDGRPKSTYKPTRSFASILSQFDGTEAPKPKREETKEIVEDIPSDQPLFRKEGEDGRRSPEAAWSIFGGNDGFIRKEEREEEPKACDEVPKRTSRPYNPTRSFADILSNYESQGRKPVEKEEVKSPSKPPKEDEKPLSDSLFRSESEDERRSPDAVWSVFGNNRIPVRQAGNEGEKEEQEIRSEETRHAEYHPSASFSSILSSYERRSDKTFDEILQEKGEKGGERPQLTISKLRTMLPQATLDLHGYTVSEAESRISSFLAECVDNGLRKISIITGKGLHSESGIGVLRDAVIRILDGSGCVSEKGNAPQSAGGSGALWIILKS